MTALSASRDHPRCRIGLTRVDRVLLAVSARIDAFVDHRLDRRSTERRRVRAAAIDRLAEGRTAHRATAHRVGLPWS